MDKESIFMGSLISLILFQGFYFLVNPEEALLLGVNALMGFVVSGVIIGIVAGATGATIGLNSTSIKILFIVTTIINLMFSLDIVLPNWIQLLYGQESIAVGMGLLYPTTWNIFIVSGMGFLGYVGFMTITLLMVITLVSGLLISVGGGE